MRTRLLLPCCALLAACAAGGYRPPSRVPSVHLRVTEAPLQRVLDEAPAALARAGFTVDAVDRAAATISLSFEGPAESVADCGRVTLGGGMAGADEFDAAAATVHYQMLSGGRLTEVLRTLEASGRARLRFEPAGEQRTRIVASAQYRLVRRTRPLASPAAADAADVAEFTTGTSGRFDTPDAGGVDVECTSSGALERRLLDALG